MYSKEEIIGEIKRVAEKLGVRTLKREEFEQNTTIPSHTLNYHLGSWNRALKEAGLHPEDSGDTKAGRIPKDDDELLLDLLRIHQETGEIPSAALVTSRGRFEYRHYGARWKSIDEAFMRAKEKFPPKPRTISSASSSSVSSSISSSSSSSPTPTPTPTPTSSTPSSSAPVSPGSQSSVIDEPLDLSGLTVDFGRGDDDERVPSGPVDFSDLGIYEPGTNSSIKEVPTAVSEGAPPIDAGGGDKMIDKQTIKLIPQTIKPKISKKKPTFFGEPVRFRGLKYAPVNDTGVAFLFGMVGHELGYVVEALRTESPDCEGKRCLDTSEDQWEHVKIDFEYKSSDFQKYDTNENESDLMVCWIHDWEECPIEVLELQAVVKLLEG